MKLYDFEYSPSGRRARMFLAEKGVEVELVDINLREQEQLGDDYRAINPWCLVPVLELDDGTRIGESVAICRYVEETVPDPPLMGADPLDRAIVAMWDRRMELDGFQAVVEAFRNAQKGYENRAIAGRDDVPQIPELAERGARRLRFFYEMLDRELAGRPFVAGDRFSIADITAICTIDFASRIGHPFPDEAQSLSAWHTRVSERPSADA